MAEETDLVAMTIEVVANYVAHNTIAPDDVPGFIAKTHAAIKALDAPEPEVPTEPAAPEFTPAVTVRKSLASRDHILSLIDGKPYKTLKRHLSGHGLTPAQYRERYGLKADYPMVAPAYSEHRREVARTLGLGRKVGARAVEAAPAPEPAPTPEPAAVVISAVAPKRGRKAAEPKPVASAAGAPKGKAAKIAAPKPAALDVPAPKAKAAAAKASPRKAAAPKAEMPEPASEPVAPKTRTTKSAPAKSAAQKAATAKPARAAKKTPSADAAPADTPVS
jgi:predicted transcriptional regulator